MWLRFWIGTALLIVPTLAHGGEFEQGLQSLHDPAMARQQFSHAAVQFDNRWQQSPSASLAVNRGRAYYLAGDLPGAIRAFHDGLALAPTDVKLQQSLVACRAVVAYPPGLQPEPLTSWRYRVSPLDLLMASLLSAIFVTVGLARRLTTRDGWAIPLAVVGLVGWLAIGTLSVVIHQENQREQEQLVVILAKDAVLRTGNGPTFLPRVDVPLPRGAEVRQRLERGGWVQVELVGDIVGWLPMDAIR